MYKPNLKYILRMVLDLQANQLREYADTLESALAREFKAFEKRVEEQAEKMDAETRDSFYEAQTDSAFNLANHFPSMACQTTFIATYSFFEHQLMAIAEHVQVCKGYGIGPHDLREKGIFAAKKYLTQMCGIAFPSKEPEWQDIRAYNRIRNVLVHELGKLKPGDSSKDIRAYIARKPAIQIDNHEQLSLTMPFCVEAISAAHRFLNKVLDAISDEDLDGQ